MSTELQQRSPSPTPQPPLPSAPGPRATALQKLYADAIAHLLKTCSYPNFAACFPTPAQQVPGSMKVLHEQFTAKLGEVLRRNFDVILAERGVVGALNELDGLVEEARRRKGRSDAMGDGGQGRDGGVPIPPHTLPPNQLYLSHLAPALLAHQQDTKTRQTAVQADNAELLTRVLQQRREIAAMVQGLENVVADLDGSVAALGVDAEGLREEARGVE
ncbi:hypothetical protein LTR36_002796 [Oleoguttula mirabilis]|uniref:MIND kinetochore complex component Nnf1 n=1 Tax=Oleoguttula mirabilis TaxID=1507867 RepID=A0AAV9JKB1_9PEZI|nr:hypothetical protein LTR36_002796 [Oleoguttula mirabilis]